MGNIKPILYTAEEIQFTSKGIGLLDEAQSCTVTEELNGVYECELKYPVSGRYFSDIQMRGIILAKPNAADRMQPFRIYKISKPMNGIITVNAQHISYDLSGIQVSPFSAANAVDALDKIKIYSTSQNNFSLETDKATVADMNIITPRSARNCLLGQAGSVLQTYRGEYHFDRYTVKLLKSRGGDNGFTVKYGVNLIDAKQEQNCQNVYTGVYPYYYGENSDGKSVYMELPEKLLHANGDFGYTKIKELDLTSEFETEPSEDELRKKAKEYISDNDIGVPVISISIKFEALRDKAEYRNVKFLEDAALGDTVGVYFEKHGISAKSKCRKAVYDALNMRYVSLELGSLKATITDTVTTIENTVSEVKSNVTRSIARIEAQTDAYGTQISALAQRTTETESEIAQLSLNASEQDARISLLVETTDDGNVVRGSAIISAINGESVAKISADRLEFEGQTLNVKVDAANIEGVIKAAQIDADGIKIDRLEATNGSFSGDLSANKIMLQDRLITIDSDSGGEVKTITISWSTEVSGTIFYATATASEPLPEDREVQYLYQLSDGNYVGGGETMKAGTNTITISVNIPIGEGIYPTGQVVKTDYLSFSSEALLISIGGSIMPSEDNEYILGTENRRWSAIYSSTGEINTSDEREKKSIAEIPQKYSDMFYKLNPVIYKFNEGTSDRYHTGFIAQSVEQAMFESGVDSKEFAGFIKTPYTDKNGNTDFKYGLRYSEFIALAISEIQKLNEKIHELEERTV